MNKSIPSYVLFAFICLIAIVQVPNHISLAATNRSPDQTPYFQRNMIDGNFDGATSAHAIDFDQDGDMDIVGAAYNVDTVAWWENDGSMNTTMHIIDAEIEDVSNIFAVDLDQDNDIDLLGTADDDNGDVFWWENDGSFSFTRHVVDSYFQGAQSIAAADFNGDTFIDIVAVAHSADDVAWWVNDGSNNFTKHTIDYSFKGAREVHPIDMDKDGDIDIVGAARFDGEITWWENDSSGEFSTHLVDDDFFPAFSVFADDLDQDGDIDLIGGSNDIGWWENDGAQNFTKHTIEIDYPGSIKLIRSTDLDHDGDIDLLGSVSIADDLRWWENDGTQTFNQHVIDSNFPSTNSIAAVDLNGDSKSDILGATYLANDIRWWEQVAETPTQTNLVSGSVSGTWDITSEPYTAVSDLTIESGTTLTIQPGVTIQFAGDYGLTVNGDLIANGTSLNSITFTSIYPSPQPDDWQGITFDNSGEDDLLNFVQVEYAEDGISILADAGSSSSYSNPEIRNSTITNNAECGVYVFADGGSDNKDGTARPIIQSSIISNNGDDGLYFYGSGGTGVYADGYANGQIVGNRIMNNAGFGIYLKGHGGGMLCFPTSCISGTASPSIRDNVIAHNGNTGIYAYANGSIQDGYSNKGNASPYIANNLIIDNNGNGIGTRDRDNYDNANPTVIHNTILNNKEAGIRSFYDASSSFNIYNNIISGNTTGLQASATDELPDVGCNLFWNNQTDFDKYPETYGDTSSKNENGDPADAFLNIFLNPLFVDAAGEDFHLQGESPAIDAGCTHDVAPQADIDGQFRPHHSRGDVGYDEYFLNYFTIYLPLILR